MTAVKSIKNAKASVTGVVDISEKFPIGVSDTGSACFATVVDIGEALK
jgi:uncharacterized protein YlxP (DUF503 family)